MHVQLLLLVSLRAGPRYIMSLNDMMANCNKFNKLNNNNVKLMC